MGSLNDLFTSYKAINEPALVIPEFNEDISLDNLIDSLKQNNISAKIDAFKTRIKENPSVFKWNTQVTEDIPYAQPTSSNNTISGDSRENTVTIAGIQIPQSWLDKEWQQECGSKFGILKPKDLKGQVITSNSGKADNTRGKKTYGPGLLYHPETGRFMEDEEPKEGYTAQELTRLFMVGLEKGIKRAQSAGCKTWNQILAYNGMARNFGENSRTVQELKQMIRSGKSDQEIQNYIMHASDRQRSQFPGLIYRRMWEARTWGGDYDPEGSQSSQNKQLVTKLNSGKPTHARFGGKLLKFVQKYE